MVDIKKVGSFSPVIQPKRTEGPGAAEKSETKGHDFVEALRQVVKDRKAPEKPTYQEQLENEGKVEGKLADLQKDVYERMRQKFGNEGVESFQKEADRVRLAAAKIYQEPPKLPELSKKKG